MNITYTKVEPQAFDLTRYKVLLDGEFIGWVYSFREAYHRKRRRIITGTTYSTKWKSERPGLWRTSVSRYTRKDAANALVQDFQQQKGKTTDV